ncbi:hypothetical protein LIER_17536 [Lithospermum erythrorhizon]|uniref:Uncharacterized protein n=1 Tax=Lithospermum erythrorhizon TaxID=34254 RepID=A0AAV3QG55_LITER
MELSKSKPLPYLPTQSLDLPQITRDHSQTSRDENRKQSRMEFTPSFVARNLDYNNGVTRPFNQQHTRETKPNSMSLKKKNKTKTNIFFNQRFPATSKLTHFQAPQDENRKQRGYMSHPFLLPKKLGYNNGGCAFLQPPSLRESTKTTTSPQIREDKGKNVGILDQKALKLPLLQDFL